MGQAAWLTRPVPRLVALVPGEAAAMRSAQAPTRGCDDWESIIYRCAIASISTSAPEGSFPTSTVERAGGCAPTRAAYTSFIPAKSSRRCRKTVVFTSLSSELPGASRIAARLENTCSVCSWIVSPAIPLPSGRRPSCPAVKTSSPTTIAWLYGAPWNGAGAASVRMTDFSGMRVLSALRLAGGGLPIWSGQGSEACVFGDLRTPCEGSQARGLPPEKGVGLRVSARELTRGLVVVTVAGLTALLLP